MEVFTKLLFLTEKLDAEEATETPEAEEEESVVEEQEKDVPPTEEQLSSCADQDEEVRYIEYIYILQCILFI